MDARGFYFIDGIRYFRVSHWDGYDYFIPWLGDVPPTFEEASAAIFDWWQLKENSTTKRFK
jgi:hypothetical protein